jgi:hypothetical protein
MNRAVKRFGRRAESDRGAVSRAPRRMSASLMAAGATAAAVGVAAAGVVAVAPTANAATSSGYEVAVQGSTGTLWTVDPSGTATDTKRAVRSDNSPAIAGLSTGGFKALFVTSDNSLWSADSTGGSPTFSQVRTVGGALFLGFGSNAAVAANTTGGWQMSYLEGGFAGWINSANPNISTGSGVRMSNKTPSVAAIPGGFSTTFMDVPADPDVDNPSIHENFSQGGDTKFNGGVQTGTNPSVAASDTEVKIAYHTSFEGTLAFITTSTRTTTATTLALKPGTSPAIAYGGSGQFVTTFVNASGNLETLDAAGNLHNVGLAVAAGTNPAIATDGSGHWKIALADSSNHLTFIDNNDQIVHTNTVLAAGTSPAIAHVTTTTTTPPSSATLTLNKQSTVNGFIPFSGAYPPFGSTQPGKLLSYTYPASGFLDSSLLFVKSGHSTAECGDPNAVVALGEGQTTTPAQLTAIYGTSTPSFSTTSPLTAVACFSGPTPTPSFINLQMSVQFNS